MRDSFLLYKSFYAPISGLSDKQMGRLFRAIFLYQIDGSTQVDADIQMAFSFFKNQMDIDRGKYQKVVERNKRNGSKGGRPSKEKNTIIESENPKNPKNPVGLKKPKKPDNENEYDNLSLKDNYSTTTTTAREDLDDPEDSVNDFSAIPEKGCAEKVPPQVPPGTYSLVPIDELAAWMKSETTWIEQLCINRRKDPEYIKRKIDEFAAHCANNGETAKDKGDCKRHFNNWLRKVEQQPNNNYTNGKRTYNKTEPPSADELDRAIAEGFARAHTRQEWEQ